jgi:hypothetical protein
LKSLKKLLRQKKSLIYKRRTDGVDVSTKNGTSSTSVNVSGKVEVKNNPVFLIHKIVQPT